MITWFLTNVVLSVAVLLFCILNPYSPHRLRFLACFTALIGWLLPWQLLQGLLILPTELPAPLEVGNPIPRLFAGLGSTANDQSTLQRVVTLPP
jgi:hypothetical protein